jgi:hypothetical protein
MTTMLAPLSLTGDRLQFDRTGAHLLAADDEGVWLLDRGQERRVVHASTSVRAIAGFDDQIWIAEERWLYRLDFAGQRIGDRFELPDTHAASWLPAPCGPPGVVLPTSPAIGVLDDLGVVATHTHRDADVVVPITARRAIAAVGSRIVLPSGLIIHAAAGTRFVGGTVLADGRSAILLATRGAERRLVTVALGAEQLGLQRTLPSDDVRMAARRGVAAYRIDASRVGLFDLRFGRELGAFVMDAPVDDYAIDPDATRLAVRCGRVIDFVDLSKLMLENRAVRARGTLPPAGSSGETAQVHARDSIFAAVRTDSPSLDSAPRHPPPLDPPPLDSRPLDPAAVDAPPEPSADVARPPSPLTIEAALAPDATLVRLAPRSAAPALARDAALLSLEVERALVLARLRAGIARAWDTRRLGYANEGTHPFELEVGALLGTERGHAVDLVDDALRLLAGAIEARAADQHRFDASPLGELAHDFELTPLELDILIAIAAPTLWGETARLYGVLSNDPARAVVDEMLVAQVLAETADRHEIAAALGPDARLVRHGIVLVAGERPRPFTTLAINPVVAARLRVELLPMPDAIRVHEATTKLEQLFVPIEPVGHLVRQLSRRDDRPVRVVIRGRRASGRRSVLAGIAARAGRALGIIDLARVREGAAELRGWLRTANLCGLIPCLVGAPVRENSRSIADVVAAHAGPVFAIAALDEPGPFPAGHHEVVLPPLSATQRLEHWRRALETRELVVADVELLSSRYRLAPGLVEAAVAHVAVTGETEARDATDALDVAIRQGRDARLARHAMRITRLPRWSDIVLPPDVLDTLRELIGRVRYSRRVYEDWGFDAVMTTGRGLTALFDGRPGTGKTMVAGVIARELGLDLYRVDVSRLVSKWIGETEKNLAEIFDAVDDGQAIILFDEADSLFGKRTEVKSSNDRYANLEVNYLLQRIDSFEGIAILTTNFGGAIDPAFRRRVSLRLSFPFPDEDAREQLWRVHLPPQLPIEGELDLAGLARRFQLTGGYIRNACVRAAFLAAQSESPLSQHHLERAVQLEYQQVGKISTSGPVD